MTTWPNPLPAANSRRPFWFLRLSEILRSLVSSGLGSPAAVAEGGCYEQKPCGMKVRSQTSPLARCLTSGYATAVLLLFWLSMAVTVHAQDFAYSTNNGTITITGYTGPGGDVTIPNAIAGLPVTSIGDSAFVASSNLTSVRMPSSLTRIGHSAFGQCTSLTDTTIPNSVTNIGDDAFVYCVSLTSVTIPDSIARLGDGAFSRCTSLTNITVDSANQNYISLGGVLFDKGQTTLIQYPSAKAGAFYTIPDTVTSFGVDAFYSCTNLTSVTIPNSVTSIGYGAFALCTSLTGVTIPNSVTSIGDSAFVDCVSLASVTIPNSITNIGDSAFADCDSLTSVTIPNSMTSIGNWAFAQCTNLTGVTIPNSVTSIGNWAFYYCTSMTGVTIPDSVTSIMDYAFYDCTRLSALYFRGNAPGVGVNVFLDDHSTAYYLPGTTGWSTNYGGIPVALWTLPYPLILNSTPAFGVQSNGFGFAVSWATNLSVVVEASTGLNNPKWLPVITNALSGGVFYFADPHWTNYPSRFYRVR